MEAEYNPCLLPLPHFPTPGRFNAFPHPSSGGWIINYNFFYVSYGGGVAHMCGQVGYVSRAPFFFNSRPMVSCCVTSDIAESGMGREGGGSLKLLPMLPPLPPLHTCSHTGLKRLPEHAAQ